MVDSKLNVHGVRNLRVIDASIIPVIPDCRIQNSVYMIGEKVRIYIHQDSKTWLTGGNRALISSRQHTQTYMARKFDFPQAIRSKAYNNITEFFNSEFLMSHMPDLSLASLIHRPHDRSEESRKGLKPLCMALVVLICAHTLTNHPK